MSKAGSVVKERMDGYSGDRKSMNSKWVRRRVDNSWGGKTGILDSIQENGVCVM